MAARKKKKAKASKKAVKRTKAKKAPAKKVKKTKSRAAQSARPAKKKAKASKKVATRKPVKKKVPARNKKQTVGEGDYEASRTFLKDQSDFVKENKARIPEMGRDARSALEGSEGPALLAAEAEARGHSRSQGETP
jgi:hypothetical protein